MFIQDAGFSNGIGELGRAYAVGPLDRSMFSVAGRSTLPRVRFLVAVRSPNCNPALEDPIDPAQVETMLRTAWDSTLDAFWRACQKFCD